MINKPTTLILGAGASAPFGFPTGYRLMTEVINLADIRPSRTSPSLFSPFGVSEIDAFRKSLKMSGQQSVDSFLEHRPNFNRIGKMAIALALIRYEDEQKLFQREGSNWYEYLFRQLNTKFDDFSKNKLSILTFNYDRSLEQYLLTALANSHGRSLTECAAALKSIPIIHLHGDLGGLVHLDNQNIRHYENEVTRNTIRIAEDRIRIIHENTAQDPRFVNAKEILSASEIICFLGFGYHSLNMERLGFDTIHGQSPFSTKHLSGSSFGLTSNESGLISRRYGLFLRPSKHDYERLDVLQFLRETGVLAQE